MNDFLQALVKVNPKYLLLDFDGVLTTNKVLVNSDGEEFVVCSRSDGIGLSRIKKLGIQPIVISTESNLVVSKRCEKLNIDCHQSIDDKLAYVQSLQESSTIDLEKSIFIGNDINDISLLSAVALPVVVNDCWPDLLALRISYRTQRNGGCGAVREVCDIIHSVLSKP